MLCFYELYWLHILDEEFRKELADKFTGISELKTVDLIYFSFLIIFLLLDLGLGFSIMLHITKEHRRF